MVKIMKISEFIVAKLTDRMGVLTSPQTLCVGWEKGGNLKIGTRQMKNECNELVKLSIIRIVKGGEKTCKYYIQSLEQMQREKEYQEKINEKNSRMHSVYVPDALMRLALERTADARKIPSKV